MTRKKVEPLESTIDTIFKPLIVQEHIVGNKIRFRGIEGSGKTLTAVAISHMLYECGAYPKENYLSNMSMPYLGVEQSTNSQIKHFIQTMVTFRRENTVVLCDEADQIFSHISTSAVERKELLPSWEAVKMGNFLMFIQHLGLGIDVILRLGCLVTVDCSFNEWNDCVELKIRDKMYNRYFETELPNASFWFKYYNRWQPTIP